MTEEDGRLGLAADRAGGPSDPSPQAVSAVPALIADAVLPGDVVQITDQAHHWFPCLVTVSETRAWGVQGYVLIPHNDGTPAGQAYIRLTTGAFERIGAAVMLNEDVAEERAQAIVARDPS